MISSDWFLPYWGHIGFWFSKGSRTAIQRLARACVVEMVGKSKEYWGVAMTNDRIAETKKRFFLTDDGNTESHRDRQRMKIISEQVLFNSSHTTGKALWLVELISDELVEGRIDSRELDDKLISAVKQSHEAAASVSKEVDFDEVSLASDTTWDKYLRTLTPDIPTFLSDWLFDLSTSAKAEARLISLFDALNPADMQRLIAWYRDRARDLGADMREVIFPSWIASSSTS